MTRKGTATAFIRSQDGTGYTIIVPASFDADQGALMIEATHMASVNMTMIAAGVGHAEFEFKECES